MALARASLIVLKAVVASLLMMENPSSFICGIGYLSGVVMLFSACIAIAWTPITCDNLGNNVDWRCQAARRGSYDSTKIFGSGLALVEARSI